MSATLLKHVSICTLQLALLANTIFNADKGILVRQLPVWHTVEVNQSHSLSFPTQTTSR